jgi:hypothetical protein
MRFLKTLLWVSAIVVLSGSAAWAALSADDFLLPVRAADVAQRNEWMAIKDESAVKTEVDPVLNTELTTAPTLQDAINKTIEKPRPGCRIIGEPGGGYAFVATGQGTYKADHENVTASRIEQRNAYVVAFMDAKAAMAQTLGEIVLRGATDFDRKIETIDSATTQLRNLETDLSESQMQTVRKVLKGYVTYAVQDEGNGSVYVTLVSSSKTRGQFGRNGTEGITAPDLREGLDSLIAEIRAGFVPPVGGRIVEVPETGEIAFVGFGSSVVRYDPEADVQEELKLQAERVAGMRAADALAGILLGDDTRWKAHVDEDTLGLVADFETLEKSDPSTGESEVEMVEYEQRKRGIYNLLEESREIESVRNGVLPAGVIRETSLDDNDYFAYGIAVYIPSLSDEILKIGKEMEKTDLTKPMQPAKEPLSPPAEGQPPTPIQRGPSGVVDQKL